jgi:LysM repeat protein
MRKWLGLVVTGVFAIVLLGTAGCVKSKLPPAPTLQVTSQALPTTTGPTPTVSAGQTVVAADATPTTDAGASPTPIPSMTPTTAPGSPTNTPEPAATATPGGATPTPTSGTEFEYTVETGDTLWGLALRFGTTVEAIKSRHSLTSDIIYKGDKLVIPGVSGGEAVTHIVQAGENLFRISLKYGTTVQAIAAANGIINPSFVYVGQTLVVPQGSVSPGPGARYHVVQPGETLWSIALKYGTTPWKIAAANGIANINFIYAGRTLRIP